MHICSRGDLGSIHTNFGEDRTIFRFPHIYNIFFEKLMNICLRGDLRSIHTSFGENRTIFQFSHIYNILNQKA